MGLKIESEVVSFRPLLQHRLILAYPGPGPLEERSDQKQARMAPQPTTQP